MSRRSRNERAAGRKADDAVNAEALRLSAEAFRKRRNRRYLFLGLVALSFPILEYVAYQYRAIEVVFINNYQRPITGLKFVYPGGEWTEPAIGPGDVARRTIRPDFRFTRSEFSTYPVVIRLSTPDGKISQYSKAGTIDYSASEIYTVVAAPPAGQAEIQHTTRPGFPLGTVRELLKRLGIK